MLVEQIETRKISLSFDRDLKITWNMRQEMQILCSDFHEAIMKVWNSFNSVMWKKQAYRDYFTGKEQKANRQLVQLFSFLGNS